MDTLLAQACTLAIAAFPLTYLIRRREAMDKPKRKKKIKKLNLIKETLRGLDHQETKKAGAGAGRG